MGSIRRVTNNDWVRFIGAVLGVLLLFWMIYTIRDILIPFVLAFIAAYILDPVVDFLERRKVPRALAIFGLVLLTLIATGAFVLAIVLDIQSSLEEQRIHQAAQQQQAQQQPQQQEQQKTVPPRTEQNQEAQQQPPSKKTESQSIKEWMRHELDQLIQALPKRWRDTANTIAMAIYDFIAPHVQTLLTQAGSLFTEAIKSVWDFVQFLINVLVFFVVTLYLLERIDGMREKAIQMLPPRHKLDILRIAGKIDLDLRHFFRGQLLVALILAVMYAPSLLLAGIPYAVPLAVIGGLGNFIPYFGTGIGIVLAIIASIFQYGFDIHIVYVLIVFTVVQLIQDHLISPKVIGSSVGLNPVLVIFSLLVFGKLLGFLGLLFGVPLASIVRVFLVEIASKYVYLSDVRPDLNPDVQKKIDEGDAHYE